VNQRREAFDSNGVIRDVAATGGGGGSGRGSGGRPGSPATFDVRAFSADQHADVYSTGAEWQFHPPIKLGTVLGSALNWQPRAGVHARTEPTWIAGVSYDATSSLRLHGSATRKVRVPSIDQLYNTSAGQPGSPAGARLRRCDEAVRSHRRFVGRPAVEQVARDHRPRPQAAAPRLWLTPPRLSWKPRATLS
jgi:outer membrane receptor protein involved in Fe transport